MGEDRTDVKAGFGGILSPGDVAKLRAKVFNTPEPEAMGAEEPARAFAHDTPEQTNPTARAAIKLIAKDDDAVRGNIATQLRSLITQTTNPAQRAELEAILDRINHTRGEDLAEALADAKSAISGGAGTGEGADTPEEKIHRAIQLQEEIEKTIKDNEKYFTDEEKRRLTQLTAERDKYAVGSEQWIDASKNLAHYEAQASDNAADRAHTAGDVKAETDLRTVRPKTTEQIKVIDEAVEAYDLQAVTGIKHIETEVPLLANSRPVNSAAIGSGQLAESNTTADGLQSTAINNTQSTALPVTHVADSVSGALPKPPETGARPASTPQYSV